MDPERRTAAEEFRGLLGALFSAPAEILVFALARAIVILAIGMSSFVRKSATLSPRQASLCLLGSTEDPDGKIYRGEFLRALALELHLALCQELM